MSSSSRFHLPRKSTALFLCDIQEKFTSVYEFESVVETAKKMVAAGKELGVPLVATEQNPTRLGSTVREIDISEAKIVVPKTRFSMCVPEVRGVLADLKTTHIVLFGIESHVCVLQTALDLLPDYQVVVLADGVSSMNFAEVGIAIQRMRDAGAQISTSESVLFQLLGDAADPGFKGVSGLVKAGKEKTREALDGLVLRS